MGYNLEYIITMLNIDWLKKGAVRILWLPCYKITLFLARGVSLCCISCNIMVKCSWVEGLCQIKNILPHPSQCVTVLFSFILTLKNDEYFYIASIVLFVYTKHFW